MAHRELTEQEAAMLAFERQWWKYAGARDATIRDRFGLSPVRYTQTLLHLIDDPAAEAHDPQTVRRLRRLRDLRRRQRSARRIP